eukprot:scaffold33370_cov58-Phaeocystis_antarctica.AAC.3
MIGIAARRGGVRGGRPLCKAGPPCSRVPGGRIPRVAEPLRSLLPLRPAAVRRFERSPTGR